MDFQNFLGSDLPDYDHWKAFRQSLDKVTENLPNTPEKWFCLSKMFVCSDLKVLNRFSAVKLVQIFSFVPFLGGACRWGVDDDVCVVADRRGYSY